MKHAFTLTLDISSKGFQVFLSFFDPYKVLFGATFIVIATNQAIERLGLMSEANTNTFKASNRTLWMQTVKEFFPEVREQYPYICKEISRNLLNIHDYLFQKGYKFEKQEETKEFFDKFFAARIKFFEEMNTQYMNVACYGSEKQSYSWGSFRYLIFTMVNFDESYPNFLTDLGGLYQEEVLKHSRPFIDHEMYQIAMQEYTRRKLRPTN